MPLAWRKITAHAVQYGRFSGAGSADDRDQLSRLNGCTDMISGNKLASANHDIGNIEADTFDLSVVIDPGTAEDDSVPGNDDDVFLSEYCGTVNLLIIQNDAVCAVGILKNPPTVLPADSCMIP